MALIRLFQHPIEAESVTLFYSLHLNSMSSDQLLSASKALQERVRLLQSTQSSQHSLELHRMLNHYFSSRSNLDSLEQVVVLAKESEDELISFYALCSIDMIFRQEVLILSCASVQAVQQLLDHFLKKIELLSIETFNLVLHLCARVAVRVLTPELLARMLDSLRTLSHLSKYYFYIVNKILTNMLIEIQMRKENKLRTKQVEHLHQRILALAFQGFIIILQKAIGQAPRLSGSREYSLSPQGGDGFQPQQAKQLEDLIAEIDNLQMSEQQIGELREMSESCLQVVHQCLVYDCNFSREQQESDWFLGQRSPILVSNRLRLKTGMGLLRLRSFLFLKLLQKLSIIFQQTTVRRAIVSLLGDCARLSMKLFRNINFYYNYLEAVCNLLNQYTQLLLSTSFSETEYHLLLLELCKVLPKTLINFSLQFYCNSEALLEWLQGGLRLVNRVFQNRILGEEYVGPCLQFLGRIISANYTCHNYQGEELQRTAASILFMFVEVGSQVRLLSLYARDAQLGIRPVSQSGRVCQLFEKVKKIPQPQGERMLYFLQQKVTSILQTLHSDTPFAKQKYFIEAVNKLIFSFKVILLSHLHSRLDTLLRWLFELRALLFDVRFQINSPQLHRHLAYSGMLILESDLSRSIRVDKRLGLLEVVGEFMANNPQDCSFSEDRIVQVHSKFQRQVVRGVCLEDLFRLSQKSWQCGRLMVPVLLKLEFPLEKLRNPEIEFEFFILISDFMFMFEEGKAVQILRIISEWIKSSIEITKTAALMCKTLQGFKSSHHFFNLAIKATLVGLFENLMSDPSTDQAFMEMCNLGLDCGMAFNSYSAIKILLIQSKAIEGRQNLRTIEIVLELWAKLYGKVVLSTQQKVMLLKHATENVVHFKVEIKTRALRVVQEVIKSDYTQCMSLPDTQVYLYNILQHLVKTLFRQRMTQLQQWLLLRLFQIRQDWSLELLTERGVYQLRTLSEGVRAWQESMMQYAGQITTKEE